MSETNTLMTCDAHLQRGASLIARRQAALDLCAKLPHHPAFNDDTPDGERLRKRFLRAQRRAERATEQIITEFERTLLREAVIRERLQFLLRKASQRALVQGTDTTNARREALREAYDCFDGKLPDMPGSPLIIPADKGY